MTESAMERAAKPDRMWWRLLPFAFVACTAVMIFSLPLFPSQDGPVHLYYVDVLRGLLTNTGPYPQYFAIKSYITPYALEYCSLLALETVFSPVASEKILVCCYVLAFMLSFRYLLRSVAENTDPWVMTAAPFCINFYIYMGFLNYAFASALVLFLCGYWLRWSQKLTPARIASLLGGFVLLLLTHPMPGAVFLMFAGIHWAVSLTLESRRNRGLAAALSGHFRPLSVILTMGLFALMWVLHFVNRSSPYNVPLERPKSLLRRAVLEFGSLAPHTTAAYRHCLVALICFAAIASLITIVIRRRDLGAAAVSLAVAGIVTFVLACTVPQMVNGSNYFPERFSIYWVAFLLVLLPAVRPPRWCAITGGVFAVGVTVVVLAMQWSYLSRTARQLETALHMQPVREGAVGVVVTERQSRRDESVSDPFYMGSVHHFRRSKAILSNAPWMDLEIIMFRPKRIDDWTYLSPILALRLLNSSIRKGPVSLDFVLRSEGEGPIVRETIERLGFRRMDGGEEMVLYSRP